MSVLNNSSVLLLADAAAPTGYNIERSLRFNSSDSAKCARTYSSGSSTTTQTLSLWVKRAKLGATGCFWSGYDGSAAYGAYFQFDSTNTLTVILGGASSYQLTTTQVFRDPSSWYHIVLTIDTNNGTSGDRIRLYVNGSRVTTFSTASYPTSGYACQFAMGNANNTIGTTWGSSAYSFFDGYLADIHFIDGQALTPSSFTEVSAITGQLIPKAYTGSFGTNGFWLKFSDNSAATAAALGNDYSGNNNDWTPNNLSIVTGGPTSVAAASGALPVYNTTDTYGTVKGTGTRTDSNSSSIVLAIPMDGANNGTTFTDESATIKGSGSAKSITVNGNAKTVTSVSKFYGSSGAYDGTGDYLSLASSADFQLWNSTAWTVECFIYINSLASTFYFFGVGNRASTTTRCMLSVNTSGNIVIDWDGTSADTTVTFTTGLATGRWYHIAAASNGTALKIYVDGIAASQTATLGTSTQANAPVSIAVPGLAANPATYNGLNGYLQDFRIYKGVAKYTSNFNPPSSTQNPTIAAGNDSLVDTPTSYGTDDGLGGSVRGNYATWNPLISSTNLTNGNLSVVQPSTTAASRYSTLGMSTGKWYWEISVVKYGNTVFGIRTPGRGTLETPFDSSGYGMGWRSSGGFFIGGSNVAGSMSLAAGDVLGLAFDADAGTLRFYKNGTLNNTLTASSTYIGQTWFAGSQDSGGGNSDHDVNFGQRAWAYTAPTNYQPLVDTLLPAPVVAKPNEVMDVKLITANNSTQVITGLAFSPDLVWTKSRSNAYSHYLYDTVRGVQKPLLSNATNAETTIATSLTSFNSDGFTLGADDGANYGSGAGVAWTWDAGTTTSSNGSGSITSQVRANASAGFSVLTWTGQTAAGTIGHGLGVAPSLIITKLRSAAQSWGVYHKDTGINNYLLLDSTGASTAYSGIWGSAAPTSTVFGVPGNVGLNNLNGGTYVGYAFAPVAGYSSFGRYTGNGSADGPFVYTGFRPRWIMVKRSDAANDWWLYDTARGTYNEVQMALAPNLSNAELNPITNNFIDVLSNGFKLRGPGLATNGSGATYIYAAFAESPFAYARAR
jgi:hypothetical protein